MITLRRRMQEPGVWRVLVWYLCCAMGVLGVLSSRGEASLVASGGEEMSATSPARAEEMARIQVFLERKIVQQRLADFGLSAEEVSVRLSQLSDEKLHQVASQIDSLQPGAGAAEVVLIVLLIVVFVVLLIYLLDRRTVR